MPTLRPAQIDAAFYLENKSALLLADVGAGKTATSLTALRAHNTPFRYRTLVLGTKRICETVWGPEVAMWAPGYTYACAAGKNAGERCAILEDDSIDIVGLNYENIIWAIKTYGKRLATLFPNLIIDESSRLENPASKSFKAIDPILPLFSWRLPMTGTPRANHLHDLWGSVYLADLGKALGEYKEAFLQYFFHPVNRRIGLDWIPKAGSEAEIYDRLKGVVYRMPFLWHPLVEQDVILPLNPMVDKIQKHIDKELKESPVVTLHGITYTRDGNRINAKMLQLSSGFVYDDDHNVVLVHDDKIKALKEIVDEARGEPIMVVFQFDHERDHILKAFPQARLLDSAAVLDQWNDGKIEILLVHPKSCGHGLNAQLSGCDLQVWFTPTTDAELYTQVGGRLNRPGNPKTIRVLRLIMQGTKDRACYNVVAARQRGEHATLDAFS